MHLSLCRLKPYESPQFFRIVFSLFRVRFPAFAYEFAKVPRWQIEKSELIAKLLKSRMLFVIPFRIIISFQALIK
jgi:hypothetical protein